ncbi:MAG TPA: SRPBCC domain-containing protein, partial [Stellaceae bacterium]|nr:SRPBCC domain-containing protein [Stellaceae bacterium]
MTDSDSIRIEVFIAAAPQIVFEFLTDPEKMRRWFGVAHWLDPRPGGRFRVDVHDGNIASGA